VVPACARTTVDSQYNLGMCYAKGEGVVRSGSSRQRRGTAAVQQMWATKMFSSI